MFLSTLSWGSFYEKSMLTLKALRYASRINSIPSSSDGCTFSSDWTMSGSFEFQDWFLIRVDGGWRAYFHNDLVNPNNILKTCIALPEPFVQTVKIRHELEIVILLHVNTHCPWPTVKDKPEVYGEHWHLQRKFQQGFVVCLEQRWTWSIRVEIIDTRISCRFTRGCLSQAPSSLVPWDVLHLLRRPSRVVSLVADPFSSLSLRTQMRMPHTLLVVFSVKFRAFNALASSFMYCERSCVRSL